MDTAQKDGMVPNAPGYVNLHNELSSFRASLVNVAAYGHIPVPLVYTQVNYENKAPSKLFLIYALMLCK